MKHLLLYLVLVITVSGCKTDHRSENEKESFATFYLIRHAEKERSNKQDPDPALTQQGMQRALKWAAYFDSISLDAIYSTNYIRTKMTVVPLASTKDLKLLPYEPGKLIGPEFIQEQMDKRILIAGHSNTTPQLVNKIIGEDRYPQMADSDNSSLFIVKTNGREHEVRIEKIELD